LFRRPRRETPPFAQLKTWAEFWADEVQSGRVVCCQTADDELVQQEPDLYDCDSCQLLSHLNDLDGANQQVWALYKSCCNRFTQDLGAGSVMLDRLTQDMGAEEFAETAERLAVVYDILAPRKEKK